MSEIWVVHRGGGGGEGALAEAFHAATVAGGHAIRWWTDASHPWRTCEERLPDPPHFRARVAAERPAAVVFSTSLTCAGHILALHGCDTPTCAIEVTWLPWAGALAEPLRSLRWFFLMLPPETYLRGLASRGGPFTLPPPVAHRVVPCGFVFEGRRIAHPRGQEVLIYLGQRSEADAAGEPFVFGASLSEAIVRVAAARPELRWTYVGDRDFRLPPFVQRVAWLPSSDFHARVAQAAALVCHHGMATISRASTAGTPILALSNGRSYVAGGAPDWSDRELFALASAGVCWSTFGDTHADALARRLIALLDSRAPTFAGGGARRAVETLVSATGCA